MSITVFITVISLDVTYDLTVKYIKLQQKLCQLRDCRIICDIINRYSVLREGMDGILSKKHLLIVKLITQFE